jgi:histone deacetylase HOS3
VTAASVAREHFEKELRLHTEDERPAETIVILHDAVYGHRYSRPRTSKANLSLIVERPERILASVLGVSAAYVRLGERHKDGRHPMHPKRNAADLPTIPFRIQKTQRRVALDSPAVTNVHGTKWMEELKIMCDAAESKLAMNGKELVRPQMQRDKDDQAHPFHEGDLYLCSESLNAMEGALGAVCEAVDAVFAKSETGRNPKRAFVAIRPPGHHCSASYPSGFCWLNNVHVGISHATLAHGLTHAAIIDFDLHHGDGSQAIAWAHNARAQNLGKKEPVWKRTSIGYFSLHDINSYPCEYGDEEKVKNASLCIEGAHGQNVWNVHLQAWKTEAEFWQLYDTKYAVLLEKTRSYLKAQTQRIKAANASLKPDARLEPKAAIFLSAGFDASEWEMAGMQRHVVNVPTEFYARLARDVRRIAAEDGCAVEGRVISVLEGGYSDRALTSGAFSHVCGLAGADPDVTDRDFTPSGLGYEIAERTGALSLDDSKPASQQPAYNPEWWAQSELEHYEHTVNPTSVAEPRKVKDAPPPTYLSSTTSFNNKIAESPKARRASSNFFNAHSPKPVRAPSPPPPAVSWEVAAHELSKLLIPDDRQTRSHKFEELSAEATRARRERQSILTPPASSGTTPEPPSTGRMALRERRPVKAVEPEVRAEAKERASRRKTVAGAAVLATEKPAARGRAEPKSATKPSSRRLSLASGVVTDAASLASTSRTPSEAPGTRPATSQARRADSVVSTSSGVPPVPALPVKNTRAPAAPKTDVTVKRAVGRPAKPAVPTNGTSATAARKPSATTSKPTGADADVDSLTSGMKKIRINLTTKAQREAKAAAAAAALAAEQPTFAVQPQPAQSPAAPTQPEQMEIEMQMDIPPQAPQPMQSVPCQTPKVENQPQAFSQPQVQPTTLAPAQTPPPVTPIKSSPSPSSQIAFGDPFLAHQALPPPTPEPLTVHRPSRSPSVAERIQALRTASEGRVPQLPNATGDGGAVGGIAGNGKMSPPVWSSTGFIPFAPLGSRPASSSGLSGESRPESSASGMGSVKQEKKEVGDIWEVPETPLQPR